MNKLKEIGAVLNRHLFWILCGFVSLLALASWYMGTSSIAQEFKVNKDKIKEQAAKGKTVLDVAQHPNDDSAKKVVSLTTEQKKKVAEAWKTLYAQQRAAVYRWPEELGADFIQTVDGPNGVPADVPEELRERYMAHVKFEFKKLAEIMDAEWIDSSLSADAVPVGRLENELAGKAPTHKLIWNGQADLQTPYLFSEPPTATMMKLVQEELWVMRALAEVIAKTNEGSQGAHDAAITMVEDLAVAYRAAEEFPNGTGEMRISTVNERIMPAPIEGGNETEGVGPGGRLARPLRSSVTVTAGVSARRGRGRDYMAPAPSTAKSADATPTSREDEWKEWRYVDWKCKPLTKEELATPPFTEFSLMPWKIRVTAQHDRIDDLLVAVRNSPLPLEVRQVRINPQVSSDAFLAGPGPSAGSQQEAGRLATVTTGSADPDKNVTLEVRGIAYLINPPDLAAVGVSVDGAGDETAPAADGSSPPAAAVEPAASGDDNAATADAAATDTTTTDAAKAAAAKGGASTSPPAPAPPESPPAAAPSAAPAVDPSASPAEPAAATTAPPAPS